MARHHRHLLTLSAAALSASLALGTPVVAQRLPYDLPPLIPNGEVSIYDVPGVPDAQGCVKQCFRDDSPCDPPLYKRTDNRCKNTNSR